LKLLIFCNFCLAVMYGSIFISKLTIKMESEPIDTIQDLLNKKDLKILVQKNSFVEETLKETNYFPLLKDRIEFFDENVSAERSKILLSKILFDSYVMIDAKINFDINIGRVPRQDKCNILVENFHFSSEAFISQSSSWIFNKKRKDVSELINLHIIWLRETGLFTTFSNKNPSLGITTDIKIEPKCEKPISTTEATCSRTPNEGQRPLTFGHLSTAFAILIFGQVMALAAFAVECLVDLRKRLKKRKCYQV